MILRVLLLLFWAATAQAQDFSALARVAMAQSELRDDGNGLQLQMGLSLAVPYRVFTVGNPMRAVVDFREVDWNGVSRAALMNADNASDVQFGPLRPGWSRLVIALTRPMVVEEAGMLVDEISGQAVLSIVMAPATETQFADTSGAPADPFWGDLIGADTLATKSKADDGPVIIAVDAGHGGIDPGAQQGGVNEADVVLDIAFAVVDKINRSGVIQAVLIRDSDHFIPLEARITRARQEEASALISLHADSLAIGGARGASVYTLSKDAQDTASIRMAERHERGDLLAGLDLSGQDDRIATVLMDLARLETGPASVALADTLVSSMADAGVVMNSRPRRNGNLAVLNAADFASALIEVGFLSSDADRALLTSAQGQATIAQGIADGMIKWAADQAALAPLIRQ